MKISSTRGYLYALLAYATWGFLPIYWKQLQDLPVLETLAHRLVWSAVAMLLLLTLLKDRSWLHRLRRSPHTLLLLGAASLLTFVNWLT